MEQDVIYVVWPILMKTWCYIKVQPHSGPEWSTLPMIGGFKWGTVWTFTSTGTGIVKGQIWTCVFY